MRLARAQVESAGDVGPHGQRRAGHLGSRLSILELLEHAFDRRDEVVEIIASSEDADEAQERIRALLGVPDPHLSEAVLDMQMSVWTRSQRKKIAADAAGIRGL